MVAGPEAPDDGEIAEPHVESGKYFKSFDSGRTPFGSSEFPPFFQAPQKHKEAGNGTAGGEPKECNGAPLLSEWALQEVRDDLQLHLCLSALFTLPLMLNAPSLIHWSRNLR